MTRYAVQYTYSDDRAARDEHRPAHREFLGQLATEGALLLSGPYAPADGTADGALLVIDASHEARLREVLRDDPFQQQGLVQQVQVREWTLVLGSWLTGPLAGQLEP